MSRCAPSPNRRFSGSRNTNQHPPLSLVWLCRIWEASETRATPQSRRVGVVWVWVVVVGCVWVRVVVVDCVRSVVVSSVVEGVVVVSEEGVAFQSLLDGSSRFLGPVESMRIQAALGSDIALTFDECTPAHADREYTARSTERTHRWLDRCLAWHEREGPAGQAVFGIVQGGVHEDLRRESAERNASAAVDGIAIGGTLGRDKTEMHGVLGFTLPHLPEATPAPTSTTSPATRT